MGTQRCPMGTDRTNSATETTFRWEGSSVARYAGSTQRDLVGLGYRRAVAGTAQEISAVPNLPPPLPAVGTGRQTGRDLACARGAIARARETGTGGGFYRRLLHGGKKGGLAVGPTKRGKGTKILAICTDHSLPLAVGIQSASPHESQLVEEVLGQSFLDELPERLIGDAAYDSDPLDDYLLETYDIELIAPHKKNRKRLTQDGRPFRRYRRRWCVERLFAWLHWFRRLVIRWEYHAENFLGEPGVITGTVIDSGGHPLQDARVYVKEYNRPQIGAVRYVTTDKNGQFRVVNLRPGDYDVFAVPSNSTSMLSRWRQRVNL